MQRAMVKIATVGTNTNTVLMEMGVVVLWIGDNFAGTEQLELHVGRNDTAGQINGSIQDAVIARALVDGVVMGANDVFLIDKLA